MPWPNNGVGNVLEGADRELTSQAGSENGEVKDGDCEGRESSVIDAVKHEDRDTVIVEIMELMEERRKDKNWLMDQIRQKRQKPPLKQGLGTVGMLRTCSLDFLNDIASYLGSDEFKDLDVIIPPITKNYHWFFTDIVAASDPTMTTVDQARRILLLNRLIENSDVFRQRDPQSTVVLPTGDGMAIGFDDSPEKPLLLAAEVHRGLRRYNQTRKKENQVQLRIGLDSGPVYMIKDINGNENVWGPGIIMA